MKAFTEQQLAVLNQGATEETERLVSEVRRLYAAENAREQTTTALTALLSSAHQQLHATGRTLETALRMMAPPQPQVTAEPERKRPRMLMDDEPATGEQ